MATLVTKIPTVAFPHELDSLSVRSDGDPSPDCKIEMRIADTVAYKAVLAYDHNQLIELVNMAELIRLYSGSTPARLVIMLDGISAAVCDVIPCRTDLAATAADYVPRHFLSRCAGGKYTSPWSQEPFALYTLSPDEQLTVTARLMDSEGPSEVVVDTRSFPDAGLQNYVVDMADIVNLHGRVSLVELKAGRRSMTLYVRDDEQPGFTVQFLNSFGQPEIWYFNHVDEKLNTAYKSAVFNGIHRNYQTNLHKEFKAYFNFILSTEVGIVEDLSMAADVTIIPDGVPLLVTAADFTNSSDLFAEKGGSITFRSQSVVIKTQADKPVNTFDRTFDKTFE